VICILAIVNNFRGLHSLASSTTNFTLGFVEQGQYEAAEVKHWLVLALAPAAALKG